MRRRMARVMRFYIAESGRSHRQQAQLEQQLAEQPDRYKRPESVVVQHFFSRPQHWRGAGAENDNEAQRLVTPSHTATALAWIAQLLSRLASDSPCVLALRPVSVGMSSARVSVSTWCRSPTTPRRVRAA